jgi:hypothetical protein
LIKWLDPTFSLAGAVFGGIDILLQVDSLDYTAL